MAVTLRIPGQTEVGGVAATRSKTTAGTGAASTGLLDDVEIVHAFSVTPADRARSGGLMNQVPADESDILEIEVDGFALWTSVGEYVETVRAFRPTAVQSGSIVVDALPNVDVTRGDESRATAVRVLRLAADRFEAQLADPIIQQEFFRDFGLTLAAEAGSWVAAKGLIWLIERRLRPRAGLYKWSPTQPVSADVPDPPQESFDGFDAEQPMLLFVHGTASSTRGSFGGFLEKESAEQWKELTDHFREHVYAFEHKTLSESPIENAIAVASQLPAEAKLFLVSHSRGGLIGDLLCLPRIDESLIRSFRRRGAFEDADEHDRRLLRKLSKILAEKKFRVQRFSRAACPARGTLLASENIDQFLSVLTYLVGLVPFLKATPAYEVVKRITLETVRRRWDPAMLPGLEAMIPESPLVRLLNETSDQAMGALGVVAGDIQGGNWLKRFGVFVSDRMLYDNRDNDLVVNTDSMFLGASRRFGRYVFDQGADVSHFNYFKNRRTRSRVLQWLTAPSPETLPDYRELSEAMIAPVPMQRSATTRASLSRPIAVLIPDMMGSDLHAGDVRVWLNREALSRGVAVPALADVTSGFVQTRSVLGEHYAPLRDFLSDTHDVIPFAYDWRKSLADAASRLSEQVAAVLDATAQSVRIIAHGAGGLVVALWATDAATERAMAIWQRFGERPGARVVLLGTPFDGTFDSVEMLLGTHPVVQQLALLHPADGLQGIINVFRSFPAVLELLPRDYALRFFDAGTWQAFGKQLDAEPLAAARTISDQLRRPWIGTLRPCHVIGRAPRTVTDVLPDGDQVILEIASDGDGRVSRTSSDVPGQAAYFADADHGALAADARLFPAIAELLALGDSRLLPTSAPPLNRGDELRRRTRTERVLYPTAADLMASVFGRRLDRPRGAGAERSGFRVSVVHGDLTFARFPIMVGHYEGDTIIGPESVVDRMFDGALTTRYNLGLYPGALGTSLIMTREPTPLQRALQMPAGAVVVGLGRWGELTAGQIANIVRRGALEYVLRQDNHSSRTDSGASGPAEVGLSLLLIGATASNISTQDSVAAMLRGIAQANLELDSIDDVHARIATLEIIELYVDTSIAATRAVRTMAAALSDELKIPIDAEPFLQRGRHGRVRYAAARNADAWRRWEVTAERSTAQGPRLPDALRQWLDEFTRRKDADPALLGALAGMALTAPREASFDRLRFVSLSDRARAEVIMEQLQPTLLERLVESSNGNTRYNPDAARALFELMVPNDLKDGLGQLSNVVFVLDGHTASLPWELITDGADQPLGTRLRIVRQLQSAEFRPHIRTTTTMSAYVVGDPHVSPPFRQLDGARREAEAVRDRLEAGKFTATWLPPQATALDVLGGLFARPYRIVHLAGHGHFDPAAGASHGISGMVLDHGAFLTAAEIRKMAQVPELVFLNCCYIGLTGPEARDAVQTGVPYNRLAASISRELIEMGVRAVVAAGWAVRDDAALFFAQAFYDSMLGGETFGRALQSARAATWRQYPDCNTWGAYQAYGDPDFRLTKDGSTAPQTERVAPEELLEQLDHIWRRARRIEQEHALAATARDETRVEQARQRQVTSLRELLAKVPESWLQRSEIRVAIGEAYGELAEYPEAIDQLEAALDTGELDSKTTIKAAEQLLNFSARVAEAKNDQVSLEKAIKRLESLQHVGPTAERYSLLGGAYKRLAKVLADPVGPVSEAAREALETAATQYESAHKRNRSRNTFDHYPVVNWLALRAVLGSMPENWLELLRQAEMNAQERLARDRGTRDAIFNAVAAADVAVVRALASGTFDAEGPGRERAIAAIVEQYQTSFRLVEATSRQRQSAIGQLATLEVLLTRFCGEELQASALRAIRNQLV